MLCDNIEMSRISHAQTYEIGVMRMCMQDKLCGIPEAEVDRVGYQLKVLDRMFKKTMEAGMRKNGYDNMTMMNGWIIGYLINHENDTIYQKDLEKKFKVGKSSLSVRSRLWRKRDLLSVKVFRVMRE